MCAYDVMRSLRHKNLDLARTRQHDPGLLGCLALQTHIKPSFEHGLYMSSPINYSLFVSTAAVKYALLNYLAGTCSVADAITDLDCASVSLQDFGWPDNYCHKGNVILYRSYCAFPWWCLHMSTKMKSSTTCAGKINENRNSNEYAIRH